MRSWARILLAAWSTGIMLAALEDATAFARQRVTFGKPIAGQQMIQDIITGMVVDLGTSRLLTHEAATLMDRGQRCDAERAMAKLHACEAVRRVTRLRHPDSRRARADHPRHFRNARFLTIADGTSRIMKLIIGRKATGIPAI